MCPVINPFLVSILPFNHEYKLNTFEIVKNPISRKILDFTLYIFILLLKKKKEEEEKNLRHPSNIPVDIDKKET